MSDKDLVERRFSKVAKTYEKYAVVQKKVAETLADILMEKCEEERENKNTPPPSRCFEIGCGNSREYSSHGIRFRIFSRLQNSSSAASTLYFIVFNVFLPLKYA